ncbi:MAG: hypothetical protein ACRDN0_05815 [Trebonia sp.]
MRLRAGALRSSGRSRPWQRFPGQYLLDDAVRLAGRFGEADVDVTLEVVAGVPHVFQNYAGQLDEADAALDRAAAFLAARIRVRETVFQPRGTGRPA